MLETLQFDNVATQIIFKKLKCNFLEFAPQKHICG